MSWRNGSSGQSQGDWVHTKDGIIMEVDIAVRAMSQVLQSFDESGDETDPIPVPITTDVLSLISEYCDHNKDKPTDELAQPVKSNLVKGGVSASNAEFTESMYGDLLCEVASAADFLALDGLLNLACARLALLAHQKDPSVLACVAKPLNHNIVEKIVRYIGDSASIASLFSSGQAVGVCRGCPCAFLNQDEWWSGSRHSPRLGQKGSRLAWFANDLNLRWLVRLAIHDPSQEEDYFDTIQGADDYMDWDFYRSSVWCTTGSEWEGLDRVPHSFAHELAVAVCFALTSTPILFIELLEEELKEHYGAPGMWISRKLMAVVLQGVMQGSEASWRLFRSCVDACEEAVVSEDRQEAVKNAHFQLLKHTATTGRLHLAKQAVGLMHKHALPTDSNPQEVLSEAILNGSDEVFRVIWEISTVEDAHSIFAEAVIHNRVAVVEYLFNRAEIDLDRDLHFPKVDITCKFMHVAAKNGNLDMIQKLIELAAHAAARDSKGNTPLNWAIQGGHVADRRGQVGCEAYIAGRFVPKPRSPRGFQQKYEEMVNLLEALSFDG